MSNHETNTESDRQPVLAELSTPSIKLISDSCVYEGYAESPQTHLGLLDTTVATSKVDDDLVTQYSGSPAHNVANQCSQKYKTSGSSGPVVRWFREDFGDCIERYNASRASAGKNATGDDHIWKQEQYKRSTEILHVSRAIRGEVYKQFQLLNERTARETVLYGPVF